LRVIYILSWNAPFSQDAQTTCSGLTRKRPGHPASAYRA